MTENDTNHQQDYTSSEQWVLLELLQNTLAAQLRKHDQDKPLMPQEVLAQAEDLLRQARIAGTPQVTDISLQSLIADYWQYIASRKSCVTTGFSSLNNALGGGLESKRLAVLLGAPGVGKTAFANQVADHIADSGRPVLYVTSEDIPFTLLAKTLARIGDVSYTAVLKGWESDRAKINAALAIQQERKSSETLHYVDATQGLPLERMRELAQSHFASHSEAGQGVLVVDYLQRFARAQRASQGLTLDLRELVTQLTEQLRSMACELDCCVLALASMNRASGYGKNSDSSALSSGKESGDIEYSSDIVMAIVEDSNRKPGASFIKPRVLRIDKNRQGDTTAINLDWQGDRQRFTEAER